jgi:hypothetical protein
LGGGAVTPAGTNLTTTGSVAIGGMPAPFAVVSDTRLSVATASGTAGAQDVGVVTTGGAGAVTGGFTCVAAPGSDPRPGPGRAARRERVPGPWVPCAGAARPPRPAGARP